LRHGSSARLLAGRRGDHPHTLVIAAATLHILTIAECAGHIASLLSAVPLASGLGRAIGVRGEGVAAAHAATSAGEELAVVAGLTELLCGDLCASGKADIVFNVPLAVGRTLIVAGSSVAVGDRAGRDARQTHGAPLAQVLHRVAEGLGLERGARRAALTVRGVPLARCLERAGGVGHHRTARRRAGSGHCETSRIAFSVRSAERRVGVRAIIDAAWVGRETVPAARRIGIAGLGIGITEAALVDAGRSIEGRLAHRSVFAGRHIRDVTALGITLLSITVPAAVVEGRAAVCVGGAVQAAGHAAVLGGAELAHQLGCAEGQADGAGGVDVDAAASGGASTGHLVPHAAAVRVTSGRVGVQQGAVTHAGTGRSIPHAVAGVHALVRIHDALAPSLALRVLFVPHAGEVTVAVGLGAASLARELADTSRQIACAVRTGSAVDSIVALHHACLGHVVPHASASVTARSIRINRIAGTDTLVGSRVPRAVTTALDVAGLTVGVAQLAGSTAVVLFGLARDGDVTTSGVDDELAEAVGLASGEREACAVRGAGSSEWVPGAVERRILCAGGLCLVQAAALTCAVAVGPLAEGVLRADEWTHRCQVGAHWGADQAGCVPHAVGIGVACTLLCISERALDVAGRTIVHTLWHGAASNGTVDGTAAGLALLQRGTPHAVVVDAAAAAGGVAELAGRNTEAVLNHARRQGGASREVVVLTLRVACCGAGIPTAHRRRCTAVTLTLRADGRASVGADTVGSIPLALLVTCAVDGIVELDVTTGVAVRTCEETQARQSLAGSGVQRLTLIAAREHRGIPNTVGVTVASNSARVAGSAAKLAFAGLTVPTARHIRGTLGNGAIDTAAVLA